MTPPDLVDRHNETNPDQPFQHPDICRIFPWRCYRRQCIHDPVGRPREDLPPPDLDQFPYDPQHVKHSPSLKYLRLLLFRANTIRSILETLLYDHQVWLPAAAGSVLGKLWFMMDISVTGVRVAFVQTRNSFTDADTRLAYLFLLKLDMVLNDPEDAVEGNLHLRRLLLAQKSLSVMDRVLKRQECLDHFEVLQMYIRWRHVPPIGSQGFNILGIPSYLVGGLEKEGWGDRASAQNQHKAAGVNRQGLTPPYRMRLLRPDELVIREFLRRGFRLNEAAFREMLLSGYHDPRTLQGWNAASVPPKNWPRKWWMPADGKEDIYWRCARVNEVGKEIAELLRLKETTEEGLGDAEQYRYATLEAELQRMDNSKLVEPLDLPSEGYEAKLNELLEAGLKLVLEKLEMADFLRNQIVNEKETLPLLAQLLKHYGHNEQLEYLNKLTRTAYVEAHDQGNEEWVRHSAEGEEAFESDIWDEHESDTDQEHQGGL